MAPDNEEVTLKLNKDKKQYEIQKGKSVGFAEYMLADNIIYFTHTEVPEEMQGEGMASKLIKFALEDAREKDYKVIPLCPFVRAYIKRHLKDYEEILNPGIII